MKNIPGRETLLAQRQGNGKHVRGTMHSLVWLKPKLGKKKSGWKCPLGGRLK